MPLAFSDSGLAYLAIAATRIRSKDRARWLRRIARQLEPSPGAAAMRRQRERARNGQRKVLVTVSPEDEEVLLRAGVLKEWDMENRQQLGLAIERLLAVLRHERSV